MKPSPPRNPLPWIAAGLVAAVVAVYWPAHAFPFVLLDDDAYVSGNTFVLRGLTAESVRWAFTTRAAQNWHPLTWLSHLTDVSLFGLDAGRHHLVNVALHASNALLLLLVLWALTGRTWRSAMVAALFALHPLHVESVAWISERKDLLSTSFGLLATGAYLAYVRRPGLARYAPVLAAFGLSLLAKPMLVTLPFVFLLLDVWPLDRLRRGASPPGAREPLGLVAEKLPLLALSAASSIATAWAQHAGGAMPGDELVPLGARLANAAVAYVAYLRKAIWPADLCAYYPHPETIPVAAVAASVLLLAAVTGLALWGAARGQRYLAVGWLWFLGMLVPVIGLVQVGGQAMADRYTYLPLVGPFVAVVWGIAELAEGRRWTRWLAAGAVALLAALAVCSALQLRHWRSTTALCERALAVTTGNWMAHTLLARDSLEQGDLGQALAHYEEAVRIRPGSAITLTNLGVGLARAGRSSEAGALFQRAVGRDPSYANGWYNLGVFQLERGAIEEARDALEQARRLEPEDHRVQYFLGLALMRAGDRPGAVARLGEAVRLAPGSAEAQTGLAVALAESGDLDGAVLHFGEAARLDPQNAVARENLEAARAAAAAAGGARR
jgi:Flp pilus assembly protein TadD